MTNKDDPGRMYTEFAGKKMSPDTLGGIIHVWDVEAVAKYRYRSLVWTRSEEFSFPPVFGGWTRENSKNPAHIQAYHSHEVWEILDFFFRPSF